MSLDAAVTNGARQASLGLRLDDVNLERNRPAGPFDYLPEVPSFTVQSTDIVDGQSIPLACSLKPVFL